MTRLAPERVIAAAKAVALPFDSRLSASLRDAVSVNEAGTYVLKLEVRGLGRLLRLMTYYVQATPRDDGGSDIELDVDDFTIQKRSFGTSSQVPAVTIVAKYVSALRQALAVAS